MQTETSEITTTKIVMSTKGLDLCADSPLTYVGNQIWMERSIKSGIISQPMEHN